MTERRWRDAGRAIATVFAIALVLAICFVGRGALLAGSSDIALPKHGDSPGRLQFRASFSKRADVRNSSDEFIQSADALENLEGRLRTFLSDLSVFKGAVAAHPEAFRRAAVEIEASRREFLRLAQVLPGAAGSQEMSSFGNGSKQTDTSSETDTQHPLHASSASAREKQDVTPVTHALLPFIVVSLVCVAVGIGRDMPPFDLFSADIFSPLEMAVAFTMSTIVGLLLVENYVTFTRDQNPFSLYTVELVVCFVAVTTTIPMLAGTYRTVERWKTFVSPFALLWFGALWSSGGASMLPYLRDPGRSFSDDPARVALAVVTAVLYMMLLFASGARVSYALGLRFKLLVPFHEACAKKCKAYADALLRGEVDRSAAPIVVPAALLVQIVGSAAIISIVVIGMALFGWKRYEELSWYALELLRPLQPAFNFFGYPITSAYLQDTMSRVVVTYFGALACASCYSIWLFFSVFFGYKRMFMDMELSRPFQGHELLGAAEASNTLNPQWATYCAGALMGNALMALFVITAGLWLIFLVLSLPPFWELQWSLRNWWMFYGLLYITRRLTFMYVIPRFVVTDSGVVLHQRAWGLLFPTLSLLNFVLGATSGVVRWLVMFPYLLCVFFRIDFTFLPGKFCEWDWSYQPFLCLVMHAHQRLNPTLIAAEIGAEHAAHDSPTSSQQGVALADTSSRSAGQGGSDDPARRALQAGAPSCDAGASAARAVAAAA
eukprot:TRINITY_DN63685_c0_g1_i1.p1 TRINITY_DN63685_c0_g1~~TRINITY_DN63685_c0_g1_i1.p1  ORF type:complete len:721 (+),score=78.21 TRINITY_DN63685_c0_g1_i1:52-2214(+)